MSTPNSPYADLLSLAQQVDQSTKAGAPAAAARAPAGGGSVDAFVAEVAPVAHKVGARLGVDPAILIGQWGLETGWGKSVIPGTNNFGNIKDFSGNGVAATDNMTGSRDRYRQYASYDAFADDFAGLLERRYSDAIGAGADALRFGSALKAGGYAEDPDYAAKLARAAEMVRGASGGGRAASPQRDANRYGLPNNPYSFADFDKREADQAVVDTANAERTWGEALQDTGLAVLGGAGGMWELAGVGYGLVTGDFDNLPRHIGEAARGWAQENQSATLQAQKALRAMTIEGQESETGKFFAFLSETLGSPELAVDFLAEQTPQLIAMGGIGRGAAAGMQALGAGVNTAAKVGTVATVGAGSTMQGLDAAGQAYDQIMALPREMQLRHPTVQKLIAQGLTESEAVARAARASAITAGALSGGASALLNALPGASTLERTLAGGAGRSGSRAMGAIKSGVAEGSTEAADEAGGVLAGNYATQQFDSSQDLTQGIGEAAASGFMFAPFGAVAGAAEAKKPNSPLTNAANAATAAGGVPPAAPAGVPPGVDPAAAADNGEGATQESTDPFAERLAKVASFVEDKTFQRTMRDAEGYGKESLNEALRAFVVARNPNTDPLMRERALGELEQFVETFNRRPNFTMGGQQTEAGAQVVPAGQAPQSGPVPQLEAPDFAERDITPRPVEPAGLLETEEALQAARNATAAYEQAYQDLVKAEQLGASDAELLARQQAVESARLEQEAMTARLAEIQQTIEGNRAQDTAAKRRAVLDAVLADPQTANPRERFAAELKRQGFRDSTPSADELATIARFEDVKNAAAAPEIEPSTPNEFDPYARQGQPAQPAQKAEKAPQQPKVTLATVKQAVADGYALDGNRLVKDGAEPIQLTGPNIAAAKEAIRRRDAQNQPAPAAGGEAAPVVAEQVPAPAAEGNAGAVDRESQAEAPAAVQVAPEVTADEKPAPASAAQPAHLYPEATARRHATMLTRQGFPSDVVQREGGWEVVPATEATAAPKSAQPAASAPASQPNPEAAQEPAPDAASVSQSADTAPAVDPLDEELQDALSHLGDVLGDVFGAQLKITGTEYGAKDLLPALSKVVELLVRKGFRSFTEAVGNAAKIMRSNAATAQYVDQISPRQWKAAYNAIAEFQDGTDSEEAVSAFSADDVKGLTAGQKPAAPKAEIKSELDAAAHEAATSPLNDTPHPTDEQKAAGNYKVGRLRLHGLDVSIENPRGSVRSGTAPDGTRWQNTLAHHYGYIRGSEGKDGDHLDVFLTDDAENATAAWVVDQKNKDGAFDEHKIVIGPKSEAEARAAYLANYDAGWDGLGAITSMPMEAFKAWALDGKVKRKPLAYVEPLRRHENATAPEHVKVETGATVEELKQIAKEWREHIDGGGDADITHVFDAPAKGEIINLEKKAGITAANVGGKRVYHRDAGWMTVEEAKAEIAKWKENARAQYDDPKSRSANSDKVVLSLFDLSGEWSKPWEEAGYQVYRFDIQDDPVVGDVNNFSTEFFNDWFGDFEGQDIYAILAATPCTDFASSGARHFAAKDKDGRTVSSVRLVKQTLAAIEYFKPAVWALENPVGRIEDLTGLPPWRLSFDPNHLGDTYTKKTLIWGRFNADLPVAPVDPVEGSKMHTQYGGKSQATKNARSVTPEGFAYGFFHANNAIDHPAMALANKFDRLDRGLIEKAIDAGVTPDEIESAVEDFYYMELDDDAANDAIRALLPAPTGGPDKPTDIPNGDGVTREPEQMLLDIPEPKNWRNSYGQAQKYAEALGVNPRGEDKKFLKLPQLVAAIEAKRAEAQKAAKPEQGAPSVSDVYEREAAKMEVSQIEGSSEYVVGYRRHDGSSQNFARFSLSEKTGRPTKIRYFYESESSRVPAKMAMERWAEAKRAEQDAPLHEFHNPETGMSSRVVRGEKPGVFNVTLRDDDSGEYVPIVVKGFESEGAAIARAKHVAGLEASKDVRVDDSPRNSAPMDELDGLRVGDRVTSDSRTFGEVVVDTLFQRQMAGFDEPLNLARVRRADGRTNDVLTSELRKVADLAPGTRINSEADKAIADRLEKILEGFEASRNTPAGNARAVIRSVIEELRKPRTVSSVGAMLEQASNQLLGPFPVQSQVIDEIAEQLSAAQPGKTDYHNSEGNAQGAGNEQARNDRSDESALAPVFSGGLQDAEGGKPAREGSRGGRGADAARDGSAAEDVRDERDGSLAGEPAPVLPDGSAESVTIAGEERPLEDVAESVKHDAPASEPKPKFPPRFGDNPGNYTITDADAIGTGTAGERIRGNMAAIRLVLELERENRYPTRDEQAVLAKYVGWGGLKNVFKGDNSSSKQEREAYAELKRLLSPEQLFWMGQSVLNAHYTAPKIVRAMYRVLKHFGVEGGRFLEPTVGTGNFIGLMPAEMAAGAKWYASEIDPVTSLIAKHLYPEAQILTATGFQDAEFAYGRMDVAIGNPPFGDERITDNNKKRADINGFKIHNYIISKSAKHLRPGGVMAFVVTSRFLDTANPEAREYLAQNFRLLGAIRLPNTAFAENAGTEVTTDIIFLQRLRGEQREGVGADDMPWLDTKGRLLNEDGETVTLNRYFAENPGHMLGKPSMNGTMYGSRTEKGEFTLEARPGLDVDAAIDTIIAEDWAPLAGIARPRAIDRDVQAAEVVLNREDVPIGGYFNDGGRIVQRVDDDADGNVQFRELTPETPWTEKQTLGTTKLARIKGMLELRELAYDLMAAERGDVAEDVIEAKRKVLNERYDAFVDAHGFLNDSANRALMADDPRIEFGLEANYTKAITAAAAKRTGQAPAPAKAEKTSLLKERVFFPKQEIEHADSPADGYAISLSEKGRLDLDYISELTGLNVDQVIADLSAGDAPLIFKDPALGRWVQEDEYLSGNVKEKLKIARGSGLAANIRALEAVQPADVEPQDIHAEFGATWIRPSVYEEFLRMLGYSSATVAVLPKSGAVDVADVGNGVASIFRADLENKDYPIHEVFAAVANRRPLVAYDRVGDERVMNVERTEQLGRIRNKLLAIWNDWIKADPERAALLARDYNEIMNTTIERRYDGVKHLRTVGANPAISLRNSQKTSAWRMVQSATTLLDHVVGAGKTIALTTGIMERKRLGLSKKPMVVVPNHLVGQWARDWLQLYPGANILAATEKDFAKANRRRLFARIATGKFDAVIVGHSSFGFIPVSREAEVAFIMKEVEHLEAALTEAKMADKGKKGKGDSRRVRGIKNRIAKRMEKIKELQDKPRDNVATFEDMGIDYLAVDELHEFKNLEYATTLSNVAGMGSPEGSKKAFDLYMKMRLLQEAGGGIAGATGTSISNSLVEMYSLLRYLNPGALAARGLEQFDAWVKAFASIEPRDEYTAAGKIKQRTVLAAFNNLPELLQMYKQVSDTVTMSDLKRIYADQIREENARLGTKKREEFPVPAVAGGARRLDIGAPTEEQVEFMDYLIARADVLDKMKGKQKQEYAKIDNALWLMNDARKMSLDVRIIDPTAPDSPNNKVNRAAVQIKALYDRWADDLGTQLVFCDLSTPAKAADKDAKAFIRTALEKLGLDKDTPTKYAIEGKTYAQQWAYLEQRGEAVLEGGALTDQRREALEAFLESVGDDERSALQVADTGFSVYDALKAKLIELGIEPREVAFIHDANTRDQKQELFDLVNSGKVRVLIGSSAKMGAGTNVQKRLVALHHMDAPWRPSDIEQREGRIIRQGNMLYERNPDRFNVDIIAYSTERTFDAQMWGVLARKAAFLEQFRHGLRSIKEEGGDAASYAEFMAEATGDEIFRTKLRLERELTDIEAEDRSAKMKRQGAEQLMATADEKRERLERQLASAQELAGADLSVVTFEGKQYRNDIAEVLEAEQATYREEIAAFEAAEEAYKLARKAWEDAAGSDRGRAPAKPQRPEAPELMAERVEAKSEWAQLVNVLTRKFETLGEGGYADYVLTAANGVDIAIRARRNGDSSERLLTVAGDWMGSDAARGPFIASRLMPGRLLGELKSRPERFERELRGLAANVEQARITLERVKPVDPQAIADLQARYEAVKKEVDAVSARMAAERAQRHNRFIARDKRRFANGVAPTDAPMFDGDPKNYVFGQLKSLTQTPRPDVADRYFYFTRGMVSFFLHPKDGFATQAEAEAWAKDELERQAHLKGSAGRSVSTPDAAEPPAPKAPPAPREIPPTARFRVSRGEVVLAEGAKDIKFDGLDDYTLFVANDKEAKRWYVIENGTGLAFNGQGAETRREAIEDAKSAVERRGVDRVKEVIDKTPKITDEQRRAAFDKYVPSALRAVDPDAAAVERIALDRADADRFVRDFVARFPAAPEIVVVSRFDQLPADVQKDASEQEAGERTVKGAFNHRDGRVYVVAGNHRTIADLEATVLHETIGHAGVRRMFGQAWVQKLNQLYIGLGGDNGVIGVMLRRGLGDQLSDYYRGIDAARKANPARWTDDLARAVLTEEVFAHIAEQQGRRGLRDRFLELVGAVRQWLRDKGFAELAKLGEADLLFTLSRARAEMRRGDTGVVREGVVTAREAVGENGRPIPQGDPGFANAMRLAKLLGIEEQQGATVFRKSEEEAGVPRGTRQEAEARGYVRAYRGASRAAPFNDTETVWLTSNREVAAAYAEEVFAYDDPAVMEVWYDPKAVPTYDMRRISEDELEALGPDEFGNPQAPGIYLNADDSPLGGGYPHTVIHVPKAAAMVVDDGGADLDGTGSGGIMAARRAPKIDTTNRRTALFTALAKFDEAFQLPTPEGKTLEAIAQEIDPGYRAKAMPEMFAREKTKGRATKAWEISVPRSNIRVGYVFEDARGRVWIDVSQLRPGIDTGNVIYGIVSGYAHNAGKQFIGDPEGLSPMAFFRRLENMISSALRYGTTDHLYPHAAQIDPAGYYSSAMDYPDFAEETKGLGLDWKEGDFSHNLSEMMRVSYNAAIRFAPELRDVIYDFDTRQFVDAATGERRSRDTFKDVSGRLRARPGARYLGGSSTLARAALVNTLLRREGKEAWRGIMVALSDQLRGRGLDFELNDIFYKKDAKKPGNTGLTAEQFRAALTDRFGEEGVRALEAQGLLNIIDPNDPEVGGALDPNNPAWYNPNTGEAFFAPSVMTGAEDAVALVLHEVGEHHGLQSMLGDRAWRTLKGRIAALAREGKNDIRAAWDGVIDTYPEFKHLAGVEPGQLIDNDRFMHEVIAKIGETAAGRKSGLWRDLLAAVNRFLLKLGIGRQINKNELADLVAGSLKRVMGGQGGGPRGGVPMASRTFALNDYAQSREGRSAIRERLGAVFDAAFSGDSVKTFNWWNRTLGSQFHKAKKSPEFAKVYDIANAFIDDVSRFANRAADRARGILPHLDTLKDIGRGLNVRQAWADAKDYAAIAPAVFEGTLVNGNTGKVWTDRELRDRFDLNPQQIRYYREFRDAVDYALEMLATSEMARAARVAKMELADPDMRLDETEAFYVGQIDAQIETAQELLDEMRLRHELEREQQREALRGFPRQEAIDEAMTILERRHAGERQELESVVAGLQSLRKNFTDKAARTRQLQAEGYAPLMRFGRYTVDVVALDEDGNPLLNDDGEPDRPFFGMFETEAEARDAARLLAEEYPDYVVRRGIMSEKANELYRGITPETAEMFARLLGTDTEGAFQAYLKQAVANRSAMKRLIQRKGMDGFAQDVPRVLSAFITSNARLAAGNWHFGDMMKAAEAVPRDQGDVKDEAIKLVDYIQNPREEAAEIRGLLFFNFLGGSIAAAAVNLTQTFTTTLPYLSQFGARKAGKAIGDAMALAAKLIKDGDYDAIQDVRLREAVKRAADEGVIDPQEIHLLMAESGGAGASGLVGSVAGMVNKEWAAPASRVARALTQGWGSLFGAAEKYNRHVAFIAAWEAAPAGVDRYAFAKNAVTETQFQYTKVNRPNWARGAVGATLFTFKTFMVNYLEFLARLPTRERALAVGVLLLLSGLSGAPGADDLDDLIDAIGQKLGYNWNNAAARHAFLVDVFGQGGANFVEHGVSSFLPIDVSARLGMGNLIPGTEAFKKSSTDKSRDVAEFFGPAGSLSAGAFKVLDSIGSGKDIDELVRPIAPKAYNDAWQAIDILQTGYYRDSRGRKVVEADGFDAFMKAIGFQPNQVAEPRRVEWMIAQSAAMHRAVRADVNELWARGVFENDPDKVAAARAMVADWNRKNPTTPIRVKPESVAQRVRSMRASSAERMVKATSRDMRGMIREELKVPD